MDNIRVITKDDYVRYELSKASAHNISASYIEVIKETWRRISKGHNFIIGIGRDRELMFYNIESFDSMLGDT